MKGARASRTTIALKLGMAVSGFIFLGFVLAHMYGNLKAFAGHDAFNEYAHHLRVLGEPMRIRVLDRLREGEATVGELAEALGTSQQNVSKHVGVLARAGLVAREKEGNSVRCRIADESVYALCDLVCGSIARQLERRAEERKVFLRGTTAPKRGRKSA